MKTTLRLFFILFINFVRLTAVHAQNIYQLVPIDTFGTHGDGSVRPGEVVFDSLFNVRGMSFDPVLTNVIVVDTHTAQGGSDHGVGHIYVLSGLTGQTLDD